MSSTETITEGKEQKRDKKSKTKNMKNLLRHFLSKERTCAKKENVVKSEIFLSLSL
jgi:hypothetical protein